MVRCGMTRAVIVCRQATDSPSGPRDTRGRCVECGKDVWITPTGQAQIDNLPMNALVYCNPCGFRLAKKMKREGGIGGVVVNPAAAEKLKQWEREKK